MAAEKRGHPRRVGKSRSRIPPRGAAPTKTRGEAGAAAGSEHGSGSVGLLSRQIRPPQDEGQVRKEVWIDDLDTLKKAAISGGLLSLRLTRTNYVKRKPGRP